MSRSSYPVQNILKHRPKPIGKMWICPECKRLNWTCEDLGVKGDREGQFGWALHRGQKTRPRCIRHPKAKMVLQ